MTKKGKAEGRYSYGGLDRIMHERSRLSILTSLFVTDGGHNFNELKKLCGLTDGNLSRQITKLKEAGLVAVTKGYDKNKPMTTVRLTTEGRNKYRSYMAELERVLEDAAVVRKASGVLKRKGRDTVVA